jgi:GTP cyclohydrolase II
VVLLDEAGDGALVQAAEMASDTGLASLERLAGGEPLLLLTGQRAMALGLEPSEALEGTVVALALSGRSARRVAELADPTAAQGQTLRRRRLVEAPPALSDSAIDLAKLARLLPAAILARLGVKQNLDPIRWAGDQEIAILTCADVQAYRTVAAHALHRVAEARVPLRGAENTRVIAFRPEDGGSEHMALIIGDPAPEEPVLVRLHSECFTGDLLSSLRCDCGDQLHGAIETIGKSGAGVILYLTQEGRGIGLVNKLRAYALQDRGADTAEANETLGFDADERIYLPAVEMLRQLGYARIRLLTNNPEKVAGLKRFDVEVVERVPHSFPSNSHNDFYLATKARRFGHIF